MSKKPHEMMPHQFGEVFQKELFRDKKRSRWVGYGMVAVLQGRKPWYPRNLTVLPEYQFTEEVNECVRHCRLDHAKAIWLAIKAGAKIPQRILTCYPQMNEWAAANGWDSLPLPDLKAPHRKLKKAIPAKDDPEDSFREQFSREDKHDTW